MEVNFLDDEVIFDDGETLIDFVLVYVKNVNDSKERESYAIKQRQHFIRVLVEEHKIQIKQVGFSYSK
jgi:hypothetical protein